MVHSKAPVSHGFWSASPDWTARTQVTSGTGVCDGLCRMVPSRPEETYHPKNLGLVRNTLD